MDFRTTKKTTKSPLTISDQPITLTDSFKFLGTHISNKLTWEYNINTICKKAQQRLFFLRQLRKYRVQQRLLLRFYFAIIQSIISSSITVWYGSADQHSKSKLQRIVNKAAKIIGSDLPSLDSIYTSRTITRATKIIKDPSHPAHSLFKLLPSGKRYGSISSSTSRFTNSFYLTAIRTLNSLGTALPLPPSSII